MESNGTETIPLEKEDETNEDYANPDHFQARAGPGTALVSSEYVGPGGAKTTSACGQ